MCIYIFTAGWGVLVDGLFSVNVLLSFPIFLCISDMEVVVLILWRKQADTLCIHCSRYFCTVIGADAVTSNPFLPFILLPLLIIQT